MRKKKSKPDAPNGAVQSVESSTNGESNHGPPVIDPSLMRFRSIKQEMEEEIRTFKNKMVAKYSDFNGHDLRKDLSWFMEQMGISIHSDMERVKREERARARDSQASK